MEIRQNHKGLPCAYLNSICQEGYCSECITYLLHQEPKPVYMIPFHGDLQPISLFCPTCGIDRHHLSQMLAEPRELVGGKFQDTEVRLRAIEEIKSCSACLEFFIEVFQILGIPSDFLPEVALV
jgi:hypothetical protein